MSAPLVSVVIPTYQRRELVRRAVGSVLAQTLQAVELIVVDDGSTDGTADALSGFGERIRYEWQENAGLAAARNAGMRLAGGELVAFLDSDDRWLPDHLAVATTILALHPDVVLCTTAPRFEVSGRAEPNAAEIVDALPRLLAENIVGHPSAVVARREPMLALGGFDERLPDMEAWEMWTRLAQLGPFALLRRRTIVYQSTRGSLSQRSDRGAYLAILAESASTIAAQSSRADAADLRSRAAGRAAYFEALQALARDDRGAVRSALADACSRLPELSLEPQLVANRLALVTFGAEGRLSTFSAAATLWPSPGADTAVYLRLHALALAVGLGRWSEAAELIRGWPLAETPGFLAGNPGLFASLVRRRVQNVVHKGRESELLAANPPGRERPRAATGSAPAANRQ